MSKDKLLSELSNAEFIKVLRSREADCSWTVKDTQYQAIREVIEEGIQHFDKGSGVLLSDLILLAEEKLAGHPDFESGRFTNWVRWIKVDMEVEGAIEVIPKSSPQRVRFSAK